MSLSNQSARNDYIGDGTTKIFPYTFKIWMISDLVLCITDMLGAVTNLTYPADYTVNGVLNTTGGQVTLTVAVAAGSQLTIRRVLPLTQLTSIRNEGVYYAGLHEDTFDRLVMYDQQQQEQINRSLKVPVDDQNFNTTFPEMKDNGGCVLIVKEDGTSIDLGPTVAYLEGLATGGASLPAGGDVGSVLTKVSTTDYDADWNDYAYSGFSARFGSSFSSISLDDTLKQILNLQYAAPAISFSASGAGSVYEKGFVISASTLTANVTKRSDPIAQVQFFMGATSLSLQTTGGAIPNGGASTFGWTGSFSDNTTFSASATDSGATGGPTTVSASQSFTFVYPYYYGAGAVGLTPTQIKSLTKNIMNSNSNFVTTFVASASQVFYFAYPASYPDLSSILDVNNFETLPDWTKSVGSITGLDGTSQSYKIYAFNNPVSAGSYQYTFKGS